MTDRTSPSVLLFDLDGTLTDTRPGMVRCLRYALARLGRLGPSDAALAGFIGLPLRDTFTALLETSDARLIDEAVSLYRRQYGEVGLYENRVYDGIPDMLESCARMASASFVATSKNAGHADRIVRHFGLDRHFAGVHGSEPDGRFERKADLLVHLLRTESVPAEAAVMVGDRAGDVLAAKTAGIRSVGVLWGYAAEGELAEAGADGLCAAPGELAACIARLTV